MDEHSKTACIGRRERRQSIKEAIGWQGVSSPGSKRDVTSSDVPRRSDVMGDDSAISESKTESRHRSIGWHDVTRGMMSLGLRSRAALTSRSVPAWGGACAVNAVGAIHRLGTCSVQFDESEKEKKIRDMRRKFKSLQHVVFRGGHPSTY